MELFEVKNRRIRVTLKYIYIFFVVYFSNGQNAKIQKIPKLPLRIFQFCKKLNFSLEFRQKFDK